MTYDIVCMDIVDKVDGKSTMKEIYDYCNPSYDYGGYGYDLKLPSGERIEIYGCGKEGFENKTLDSFVADYKKGKEMPKIIIESKISSNGGGDKFKLKINDEKIVEVKFNEKTEIDVDYGEQTLQVCNNFLIKTPKKVINVESDNQNYRITLHFKAWGIIFIFQILMAVLIMNIHQAAVFIAIPIFILEILILIFMGMFEIKEVKRKED